MNTESLTAKLLDLVEGRETPETWQNWWDEHETELEALLSRGEFLKLKPCRHGFQWVPVFGSQKRAIAILEKSGTAFEASNLYQERYLAELDAFCKERVAAAGLMAPDIARQLTEAYTGGSKGDLTADIISLIRRATIGAPLTSHEERIHRAIDRLIAELRAEPGFTKMQENFLRKIEKYFLADENYVVSMQMFHDDPRFTRQGNIAHFDKLFGGRLAATIDKLSTYLYDDTDGGKLA